MKPQGWDEFLKHLAREYGVQGKRDQWMIMGSKGKCPSRLLLLVGVGVHDIEAPGSIGVGVVKDRENPLLGRATIRLPIAKIA